MLSHFKPHRGLPALDMCVSAIQNSAVQPQQTNAPQRTYKATHQTALRIATQQCHASDTTQVRYKVACPDNRLAANHTDG
jgi:hypothetical protein